MRFSLIEQWCYLESQIQNHEANALRWCLMLLSLSPVSAYLHNYSSRNERVHQVHLTHILLQCFFFFPVGPASEDIWYNPKKQNKQLCFRSFHITGNLDYVFLRDLIASIIFGIILYSLSLILVSILYIVL